MARGLGKVCSALAIGCVLLSGPGVFLGTAVIESPLVPARHVALAGAMSASSDSDCSGILSLIGCRAPWQEAQ